MMGGGMDISSTKKNSVCWHPRCYFLTPGRSLAQRGVLQLGLNCLDLMMSTSGNPQKVEQSFVKLARKLSGLKIRHQKAGHKIWPYLEGGTGECMILLHGFGADKDRLGGLGPLLRRFFRVIIPDVPGFGDHLPDWSGDYGIDAQVRRFNKFIDAAGIGEFHLMGISLGGYIAGCYAARYPHRVKSLFLMDSAGFSSPVSSDALHLFNIRNQNLFLPSSGQQMQEMINFLMHRPVQLPATIKRYWMQQVLDKLPWRQKILDDLFNSGLEQLDELAKDIKAPTLVVWGAEDRICHVSAVAHIMGMIEHCIAYIIHGCGHIPIIEFPGLVNKIYLDFLRKNGETVLQASGLP
jgi:pimeloyl-ACP methyl ester carboxylesterase